MALFPTKETIAATAAGVAEKAGDLIFFVILLSLVERAHGVGGLGEFSFFLSLFALASRAADFGVSGWAENEWASGGDDRRRVAARRAGRAAAATGLGAALLLLALAAARAGEEPQRALAFLALALALPLALFNSLRRGLLHGAGRHTVASRLALERGLLLLGAAAFLLFTGVPPLPLLLCLPAAEFFCHQRSRAALRLPGRLLHRAKDDAPLADTLRRSRDFLFADQTHGALLHIDIFVLGLLVPSHDLGLYARVAVMARAFLVFPVSLQPLFRRLYARFASRGDAEGSAALLRRATAGLFTLHAAAAVAGLVYFPRLLHFFFSDRGLEETSFRVFAVLLPGLLYHASLLPSEPLLQVLGRPASLRGIAWTVFTANLLLNVYLVPYAGYMGAAAASSLSMGLHFLLFLRRLERPWSLPPGTYLLAGGAAYLAYALTAAVSPPLSTGAFLVPALLLPLFAASGLYGGRAPGK